MVLAERTLPPAHQHHLLPPSISHGPSNETLELLSKWLPVGPISAQDPVAAVVDEEVRLVNSIYQLLGEYDYAHTAVQQVTAQWRCRSGPPCPPCRPGTAPSSPPPGPTCRPWSS